MTATATDIDDLILPVDAFIRSVGVNRSAPAQRQACPCTPGCWARDQGRTPPFGARRATLAENRGLLSLEERDEDGTDYAFLTISI